MEFALELEPAASEIFLPLCILVLSLSCFSHFRYIVPTFGVIVKSCCFAVLEYRSLFILLICKQCHEYVVDDSHNFFWCGALFDLIFST
ncbi:hypothetical protein ACJIZ3_006144 [Penstemon smallii]|uniref:Uncharacterized protein n=1 Tax=Penstemon smallii TaxID=265156 RepID=A0ABD3S6Y4_9LAMI